MARKVSFKLFGYAELTPEAKIVAVQQLKDAQITDPQLVLDAEFTKTGVFIDPSFLEEAAA